MQNLQEPEQVKGTEASQDKLSRVLSCSAVFCRLSCTASFNGLKLWRFISPFHYLKARPSISLLKRARDASERSQPCFLFTCAYLFFIQEALGLKFLIIIHSYIKDGSALMFLKATVVLIILKIKKHSRLQYMFYFICIWSFKSVKLFQGPWVVEPEIMKWNLFKKKPEAMVGPEPTGLGGTHPSHTMTMAPAISTPADTPPSLRDPSTRMMSLRKSKASSSMRSIKSHVSPAEMFYSPTTSRKSIVYHYAEDWPNCQAPRYLTKLTFFLNYSRSAMQ